MKKIRNMLALAALVAGPPAHGQITMNYADSGAGSITTSYNDGAGGILNSTPGYTFAGNGTAQIQIKNPGNNPLTDKLSAVAGISGFTGVFYGSTATGSSVISGTYTVAGAPAGGAAGALSGDAEYLNYIGAAGVAKLTGSGTTSITSNIAINPFAAVTPGPMPNPTEASAAIGIATAGSTDYVVQPFGNAAIVPNGPHAVSINLNVTASRTGGAVTSIATWRRVDPTWTLAPPPPPAAPVAAPQQQQGFVPPGPPQALTGVLQLVAVSNNPENLACDSMGNLVFSSMNPGSTLDIETYAESGPSFQIGAAGGLGFLSGLELSESGQLVALQSFDYEGGEFQTGASGLMTVDPSTGVTTPIALSESLNSPGALAFGRGGFGSNMLVTELNLGSDDPTSLLSIDGAGIVSTLIGDLGVDNAAGLALAPTGFGGFGDDLFILNVGDFANATGGTMTNGTGSILRVDDLSMSQTSFLSTVSNPISMAFGDGGLLGQPGTSFLFVLSLGDIDQTTGLLAGNGTLTAYDAFGVGTLLAQDIYAPSSISFDCGDLHFTSGNSIYVLVVPEPGTLVLCATGLSALVLAGRWRGRRIAARPADAG